METIEYWREPTPIEIKRGWGAIHYREFPLKLCLDDSGKPMNSIISELDGLRYFYAGIEYYMSKKCKPKKISA
ncbi:MAG: hypothetical protein C0433_05075 [Cyclobacterium sp.]|nr:hypothetical protein [Cyclobacterium sp.]